MNTVKSLPKHQQPREKFVEKGPSGLTDAELVAILIRTGVKGMNVVKLAKKILRKYSLSDLLEVKLSDLEEFHGLGETKAIQLLTAFEIAKRAKDKHLQNFLKSPEVVVNLLHQYKDKKKEYFICCYLNARHQLIQTEVISIGHLTSTLVHPREVYKPALQQSAVYIILAHNHPSGNVDPSEDDLKLTERLVQAGKILGVEVLDHIIIAQDHWQSLKALGYIK